MKVLVPQRWKTVVAAIIGAALVQLSGCSAVRLSYNQGPTLAYWWLDRYADFSSAQAPQVHAALDEWFAWHRSTQLPEYLPALALAQKLAADSVGADQVCAQFEAWQQRAERAYDQAVPAMAELVRSFTPAQIKHLEQRYARNLAEAEHDYLQPDPTERREANFKRTLERAETLYGRLDDPQRQVLWNGLAASPFDPHLWLAERKTRQQDTVQLLRQWQASRADAATVQAGLRRIAADQLASPRPAYRAYARKLTEGNCALGAQLHNATTPAQRRQAVERLKGWEEDLRALIARR